MIHWWRSLSEVKEVVFGSDLSQVSEQGRAKKVTKIAKSE